MPFKRTNMNWLMFRGERLREFDKQILSPITHVPLSTAALVGAATTATVFIGAMIVYPGAPRLAFDESDMSVYFASARWVIEGGRLYREVASDYPLFANIIFATVRYLGN